MVRFNAAAVIMLALLVSLPGCSRDKSDEGEIATMPDQSLYHDEPVTYDPPAEPTYNADRALLAAKPSTQAFEPAPQPEPVTEASRLHTVQKKETLFSIARLYYGDQSKWKQIYQANRGKILNPNVIYVGQQLVIP